MTAPSCTWARVERANCTFDRVRYLVDGRDVPREEYLRALDRIAEARR